MIRRSHSKARPELPRRAELRVVAPSKDPKEGRDGGGRFAPRNKHSADRGWRTAATRLLGRDVPDPVMRRVSEDMRRLHGAVLREVPASDSVIVRTLAAQWAQVSAACSYWGAVAIDKGLSSAEGIAAAERSRVFGQRSERVAVSLLDLGSRMASAEKPGAHDVAVQAGLQRLEEYRRRTEAENANASPDPAEGQDEGFAGGVEADPDDPGPPEPEPEPEDLGCPECGDPDPTRGGASKFCCTCGRVPRRVTRREGSEQSWRA